MHFVALFFCFFSSELFDSIHDDDDDGDGNNNEAFSQCVCVCVLLYPFTICKTHTVRY